ncbi:hypothetical protein ACTXT7_006302 [Hymenolepis weldensis]
MLDADSVFDRLLKEATNLIPKMSTPKLSAALNVSSALHQRINDILASRLSQEQTVVSTIPPKNFCVQGVQSIVGTPVISDEFVPESAFLATGDPRPHEDVYVLIYPVATLTPKVGFPADPLFVQACVLLFYPARTCFNRPAVLTTLPYPKNHDNLRAALAYVFVYRLPVRFSAATSSLSALVCPCNLAFVQEPAVCVRTRNNAKREDDFGKRFINGSLGRARETQEWSGGCGGEVEVAMVMSQWCLCLQRVFAEQSVEKALQTSSHGIQDRLSFKLS